ncbi:motility associated factor glycosyltransferase family protein [Butyrivibrio sp. INlla16]|uniref:motility associated factor glycosyltransferase family protein n=1 Tax=Butyrivibrio sp. INlla16 TaxID=1520807 RepID=UPI000882E211|nr:6-hydroxymethylpterin diphosphokinase MptE-like protein [Butyrivibrio sp. INlla16]SDB60071.1 Uncharacterized conserved protein [Butyrivibrio sp. INlla16]
MAGEKDLVLNDNLRERNFILFEARYGFRPSIDPMENEKYYMRLSLSGEPVLYIRGAAPYGDLRMISSYDPDYEAKKWAEKQKVINRKTSFAILGFSTGAYLKALTKVLRPDTMFYVFEPLEDLFAFVCGFVDLTIFLMNMRIRFFINENQRNHLSDLMINDAVSNRPEFYGVYTPFYGVNAEFDNICDEVGRVFEANKNYQNSYGRISFECRLYSWNHMRNSYFISDLIKLIPEGVPAIIVSAGPSLRKNVRALERVKNKAIIICTDRAISVLNEFGIVPDFITSLDPIKNPDYLDVEVSKNVPLICSHQVNIETQKRFSGKCIFYHALRYERYILGDKVLDDSGLDQGGNVAGGSFVLCKMLGIKTIILIGQDLAHLNGKHHADNVEEVDDDLLPIKEIEGIDGSMVTSNDMWIAFKEFFERQIKMDSSIRVIDATEGGAKIYGTEIMTLSETIDTVCNKEYNIADIFVKLPKGQTDEEYKETVERERQYIKDLNSIAENAKEAEKICDQLLKVCKYQDIADPKYMKKLNKLDEYRAAIYDKTAYYLMEDFWIKDLYDIPDYTFMVRNNEEALPVFTNAVAFYHNLPKECDSLKEKIKEAIDEGMN